jgi:hypothetical protein
MICGGVWIPERPRVKTTASVARPPKTSIASVTMAMTLPARWDLFSGE